jgi:hypothetical protein
VCRTQTRVYFKNATWYNYQRGCYFHPYYQETSMLEINAFGQEAGSHNGTSPFTELFLVQSDSLP